MNLAIIKSKQDIFRVLSQQGIKFYDGYEVVHEGDAKSITAAIQTLARMKKKFHVIILERP